MSDEDTDNKIKERLNQIFPNPQVANAMVNIATSNKPHGWGPRSNSPYFKSQYAEWIKEAIDRMMGDFPNAEIAFHYSSHCVTISKQTLYNKINQSIRYLLARMDPDHKYARWYESVEVDRTSNHDALIIKYIKEMGEDAPKIQVVQAQKTIARWRRELDEWLEGPSTTPFVQSNLLLGPDEIKQLKTELAGLNNVMASISQNTIRVIKVNV